MFTSSLLPRRLWLVLGVGLVVLASLLGSSLTAQAATAEISSMSIATSSATLGGSATYTVTFTNTATLASGDTLELFIHGSTGCSVGNWQSCTPNLSAATISGLTAHFSSQNVDNVTVTLDAAVAAGTHTLTLSGVTNPAAAVALRATLNSVNSDPLLIGTPVVSGTVTAGGVAVANTWVETHNSNWSVSAGASTDEFGFYAIFADYQPAGTWASGSYSIVAYPAEGSGYITTAASLAYQGSALQQTIALSAAEYFFSGTVSYGAHASATVTAAAGDPVTDAMVCFGSQDGSGSYCDATNAAGEYTVAVLAGNYNAWISGVVGTAVDWHYESAPTSYTMTTIGTTTVNFNVDATTATVSGTVTIPDSTEQLSGSIGFSNESSNYWGQVTAGSYEFSLNPGTYGVWFSPDIHENPDWERYSYSGTATIAEGANTYDVAVETLTATVTVTVQTADGTPVEDIQVNAWRDQHSSNQQTGSDGTATLFIAADQWYEVGLWDDTYLLDGEFTRVNVASGDTASVSFTVKLPDATIAATIVDSNGDIPEQLHGWLNCESENHTRHYGTNLNNGTAELGVAVGTNNTFTGQCHIWIPDASLGVAAAQEVTVAQGETVDVTFTLQGLDATINAIVKNFATGKKIAADPSVNVNLWNESDNLWHNSWLEENPVSIPVVSNKPYSGGVWSEDSQYIPLWSMNSESITVASGETGTLVLNVLQRDGNLTMEVNNPNGEPVDYGWAWCGNWEEVNFAADTLASNAVINSGGEIRDGVANVPLVSGHSYKCGVGAPPEFIEQGWMSPPDQAVTFTAKNDTLPTLTFQFQEADANLQGSVTINQTVNSIAAEDADEIWCWAWSEGGSSWTAVEPGEAYRLNVDTSHDQWSAGCDAVVDDVWYFTEEPYQFGPVKGKNTHDFTLKKMTAWVMYEPVSETFDSTENRVITYGDGTRLTIPAGTLASSGNVTVRGTPETNIVRTDDNPLMVPIDWEAFDESGNLIETFPGGDVTIEVSYSDAALTEFGVNEDALVGKYWDDLSGSWKTPDNVTIDKENNVITIVTNHFTQYGVLYNARISDISSPTAAMLAVGTPGQHNVPVTLRTPRQSERATRFIVQVRKPGQAAKANWQSTTIRNPQEKRQLARTIQKLKRRTSYQIRAKACNAGGCSSMGEWLSFTTR